MKRCKLLAEELRSFLGLEKVVYEDNIREVSFGDWEEKSWGQIESSPDGSFSTWCANYVENSPPCGESLKLLSERFSVFYARFLSEHKHEINNLKITAKVLVISHQSILRVFVASILDMPLVKTFNLQFDFGSISRIDYDRKIVSVSGLNI